MDQRIEAPTASDIDRIAKQLIHAESVVIDIAGRAFDGSRADLSAIQSVLDADGGLVPRCYLHASVTGDGLRQGFH